MKSNYHDDLRSDLSLSCHLVINKPTPNTIAVYKGRSHTEILYLNSSKKEPYLPGI